VSPQRPQRCASTNSATAARLRLSLYLIFTLIYQACLSAKDKNLRHQEKLAATSPLNHMFSYFSKTGKVIFALAKYNDRS
ncbi:hypothetical protein N8500_09510, partial [Candidatus Puniceispirillum sp.]|nr:hypothetical protein [Candidatus Puniceispirillum sp.]